MMLVSLLIALFLIALLALLVREFLGQPAALVTLLVGALIVLVWFLEGRAA